MVGMINRRLAEQLWPGADAIGRMIYRTSGNTMLTVVGVVGDVSQRAVGLPPSPEIYIPLTQTEWASGMNVVVRTSGMVPGLDQQLRQIVKDIDPNLPVTRVASMDSIVTTSVESSRFYGLLFSSFAILALVLGGIGIYGILSAVVGERTDEIGIRLALGATRETILGSEIVRGGRTIAVGIVAGLVIAVLGTVPRETGPAIVGSSSAGSIGSLPVSRPSLAAGSSEILLIPPPAVRLAWLLIMVPEATPTSTVTL